MPQPHDRCVVVCLCAEWCTVCREYRTAFDALALEFPDSLFTWVDVEDSADVLGPVEIENFPTIAIGIGDALGFFGSLNPQREVLRRVLTNVVEGRTSIAPHGTEQRELYRRLLAHAHELPP